MLPYLNSFIPVMVIDEDGDIADPNTERLVSLPAIPHRGDSIVLDANKHDGHSDAIVTEVAYYARESSPTPLQAYIHIFVSYARTRREIEAEG